VPELPDAVSARVIWAPSARAAVLAEAGASADGRETGGILLGHSARGRDPIRVSRAGDPGPRAERHPDRFLRDLEHAQRLADEAWRLERAVWIGEWHTHPHGDPRPSARDLETYARFLGESELGFDMVVAAIVTPAPGADWAKASITTWVLEKSPGAD
jgi:integrative and conjugative element protein (TIGR02256 family)